MLCIHFVCVCVCYSMYVCIYIYIHICIYIYTHTPQTEWKDCLFCLRYSAPKNVFKTALGQSAFRIWRFCKGIH